MPDRTADPRDCRRSLSGPAQGARRRLAVRQRRDRFRPDHRGAGARRQGRHRDAGARGRTARERRGRHGARLLSAHRPPAGGHGARQRRHGERAHGPAQCRARQRADLLHLGAHAAHRDRSDRQPRCADPLGSGDVRPGRHAARVRQVGLRAALWRAGRGDRRPGAGHRHGRAARPDLSEPAARGAGGTARGLRLRRDATAGGAGAPCARRGRHRARSGDPGNGGASADRHGARRPRSGRRRGARPFRRALRHARRRVLARAELPAEHASDARRG